MSGDTLEVLLVEDNPGDARLVEEMLVEEAPRLERLDLDGSTPERSEVNHESDLAAGLERLSETDPDLILLDLGLPDSNGLETLDSVVDATEYTPVIVFTGLDDRELGIRAIQHGAHDYLVKNEVEAGSLVRSIQYAIEQARQERERIRHREQLEALNHINRLSQDVTHAVITSATRDELERAVCERLVGPNAYAFAWFGDVNRPAGRFESHAEAAVDGGFDVASIPLDDAADYAPDERDDDTTHERDDETTNERDDETTNERDDDTPGYAPDERDDDATARVPGEHEGDAPCERPEARALRTREVQVVQDLPSHPAFESCRDQLDECGYRSMAAIPVTYRNVVYGILAIYDTSPDAFTHIEVDNLARWGDVVGHAITALERRKALESDAALQLAFRVDGMTDELVTHSTDGWTLEFERLIRSDDGLLVYGWADGIPEATLREVVGRSSLVDELRKLSSDAGAYEIEFVTNWGSELVSDLANQGGLVSSASIGAGELRFVVEVSPGRDKHQLVDLVQDHCPRASLQAQRTRDREEPNTVDSPEAFTDRLTEKQRAALETAYHAGYFDWPRSTTGQEIADRLGITQATFSQHFRAAERTVFDAVFETDAEGDEDFSSPWGSVEADNPT